jgi:hypothetical protein
MLILALLMCDYSNIKSGGLTGSSSIHVSPAAMRNMQAKARSNLRNSPGAAAAKKLTPRIASADRVVMFCPYLPRVGA